MDTESTTGRDGEHLAAPALRDLVELLDGVVDVDVASRRSRSLDWTPLSNKRSIAEADRYPAVDAVVRVASEADVVAVLAWAAGAGVPIRPVGGRSSVVGGIHGAAGEIAIDLTGLNRILTANLEDATVLVETGVFGGDLERYLQERGLALVHQPQSLRLSTVGGWLSTRASGVFSSAFGNIEDLVTSLRVVLASGDVVELDNSPRRSVGPDLRQLFIGAEGTLGVITQVGLAVRPASDLRLRSYTLPTLRDALDVARQLAQGTAMPSLLRVYDDVESQHYSDSLTDGRCLIIVGWHGPAPVTDALEADLEDRVRTAGGEPSGEAAARRWFDHRQEVEWMSQMVNTSGGFVETIEVATSWSSAVDVHARLRAVAAKFVDHVEAHFSHAYSCGTCMYLILRHHFDDDDQAIEAYERLWTAVTEEALRLDVAISHHHGIGRIRLPWLAKARSGDVDLLRAIKRLLDPLGLLNPGVLLDV